MGVAGKEMRGNCCSGVQRNALEDEKCPILARESFLLENLRTTQELFWVLESFQPDEAALELDDLFPDSKLWERPPFESELEAVWV